MTRAVLLIGAFDRFNFGDLLFPHILRHVFDDLGVEARYLYGALEGVDLRARGGVCTLPLSSLKGDRFGPDDAAVVAGGEVLSARWLDAWLGAAGRRTSLATKLAARVLGTSLVDAACRRLLGGRRPQPWVLDARDLGGELSVIYNAVGGVGLDRLPPGLRSATRDRLGRAAHLSVRDPETRRVLESWDLPLDVELAPDCGVLVADVFPVEALARGATPMLAATLQRLGGRYVVFQVGRYPAWGRIGELAAGIARVHAETGLAVLLLPLGQASGHDDVVPLRRIRSRLGAVPAELLPAPTVTDILAAIAGAELFMGSSLHGNLAALAYGVPHVPFGPRVGKLDATLRCWDRTCTDGSVPIAELAPAATTALDLDRSLRDEASAAVRRAALAHMKALSLTVERSVGSRRFS